MRSIYDYVPAPIAHWPFNDNAASTVVREVMAGQHGTAQRNTNLMHVPGKKGGALNFNGTSDWVNTNKTFQSVFRDSFSINLWCKPDDGKPENEQRLLFSNIFENQVYMQLMGEASGHNGEFQGWYRVGENTIGLFSGPAFADGQETSHMVSLVVEKMSSSTARILLYFDGVLVKTGNETNCTMSSFTTTSNLVIASEDNAFFAGSIDDVMIFNKALTASQFKKLYDFLRGKESIYGPRPNSIYEINVE